MVPRPPKSGRGGTGRLKETVIRKKSKAADPSKALIALIFATLDADKAEDILVIDLRGKSALTDYMVIATGSSSRQVSALAERLAVKIKEIGGHVTAEGLSQGDWVLLDAGDAVVHLFRPEVRAFYNLEKIWGESLPVAKTGSSS